MTHFCQWRKVFRACCPDLRLKREFGLRGSEITIIRPYRETLFHRNKKLQKHVDEKVKVIGRP